MLNIFQKQKRNYRDAIFVIEKEVNYVKAIKGYNEPLALQSNFKLRFAQPNFQSFNNCDPIIAGLISEF